MMSMWTAIALIAIASIFAGRKQRRNSTEAIDEIKELHAKVDALADDLRERVETLERIVTNPKEDLKRQFEHLDKAS
jgi:ABC-type uncharacterized transport system YnjBCD ATPase subunit